MPIKPKKIWTIILIAVALIFAIATTLPLQSDVTESIQFQSNIDAIFRQLMKDSSWHQWWPGQTQQIGQKIQFTQKGFSFSVRKILPNALELQTSSGSFTTTSTLRLASSNGKVVSINLTTSTTLSRNPIHRVIELVLSARLRDSYKEILSSLSNYFSVTKNLYGFNIRESKVAYEYVTAVSKTLSHEASAADIYQLVDRVKAYIKKNNASELSSPMVFFKKNSNDRFFVQVAIPTSKQLPDAGDIKSKWMLKGGFILTAKVIGGKQVISSVKKQMEQYIDDNHRNAVAIPFESLITNRFDEPDSSKWITEVCYPII